jgi:hypothetical protein
MERKLMVLPKWRKSRTEHEDPMRANERIDKVDPKDTESSTERLLPNLAYVVNDMLEPSRANARTLQLLPKLKKSNTEIELPRRIWLKIERAEPHRPRFLMESAEPN